MSNFCFVKISTIFTKVYLGKYGLILVPDVPDWDAMQLLKESKMNGTYHCHHCLNGRGYAECYQSVDFDPDDSDKSKLNELLEKITD